MILLAHGRDVQAPGQSRTQIPTEIDIDDLRALLRDAGSEIALLRAERAHEDADAEFKGAARALAEVEARLNALERGGYAVASRVCSRHSERTSRFDCIDGPPP